MTNWTAATSSQPISTNKITVISPTSVEIDGIDCGKLCDAIANMPQLAPLFQIALESAWKIHTQDKLKESS